MNAYFSWKWAQSQQATARAGVGTALAVLLALSACGGGDTVAIATPDATALTNASGGSSPAASTPVVSTPTTATPTATTPTASTPTTPTTPAAPALSYNDAASATAAASAAAMMDSNDAKLALAGTNAAGYYGIYDGCYKNNGTSKAIALSDFDAFKVSDAFRANPTRSNVTVLSDKLSDNADGSKRRVLSVGYKVNYTDGTSVSTTQDFISGSSSGTCATPSTGADWRVYGNQRIANVILIGRNIAQSTNNRTTGANIDTRYRRELQLIVIDPAGAVDYAVVSAPAIGKSTSSSNTFTYAWKLLSPRLISSAPEMVGTRGHYTNYSSPSNDAFATCLGDASGALFTASTTNCTAFGAQGVATGTNLTINAGSPTLTLNDSRISNADALFDTTWGLSTGMTFTFALYKDDGWKTVNGQAGKTPIATYTAVLNELPFTFAEMFNGSDANSRYPKPSAPRLNGTSSFTLQQAADAVNQGTGSYALSIAQPSTPNGSVMRLQRFNQYFEGQPPSNTNGAYWPALRFDNYLYPDSSSTSFGFNFAPVPNGITSKSFANFAWQYTDRDKRRVQYVLVMQ